MWVKHVSVSDNPELYIHNSPLACQLGYLHVGGPAIGYWREGWPKELKQPSFPLNGHVWEDCTCAIQNSVENQTGEPDMCCYLVNMCHFGLLLLSERPLFESRCHHSQVVSFFISGQKSDHLANQARISLKKAPTEIVDSI